MAGGGGGSKGVSRGLKPRRPPVGPPSVGPPPPSDRPLPDRAGALFFFHPRSHFRSFFLLLGVFSWNFVFEDQGPQMSTFWLSSSKRAHNTTKIPRKDPQEREERKKIVAGEGKKSAKFWTPKPSVGHHHTLRGRDRRPPGDPPEIPLTHAPETLPRRPRSEGEIESESDLFLTRVK